MAKTVRFVVKLELPEGVNKQGAADYVRDAVQCWRSSLRSSWSHDPDPMFMLDHKTVTVRPYCEVGG